MKALSRVTASAHPNLALIKYWGKSDSERNLPATPSIGISIHAFLTSTSINRSAPALGAGAEKRAERDLGLVSANGRALSWSLRINGISQDPKRFAGFFQALLNEAASQGLPLDSHLEIESSNNFPTAAGLASSASGFAALAGALSGLLGLGLAPRELSALARLGSGSASRSIFGGFVSFPEGAEYAAQAYSQSHWPELRCIIITVNPQKKALSSRRAMERCRISSPYYDAWVKDAPGLYENAMEAIDARDLWKLGSAMRRSYLRMFSTMFSSDEPIIFWQPASIAIIRAMEAMRERNVPVFETMDAGPQVKVLSLAQHCDEVIREIEGLNLPLKCLVSKIGSGLEVHNGQ